MEKIDGEIALDTPETLEDSSLPVLEEDTLQPSSSSEVENQEDTITPPTQEESSSTEEVIPAIPIQEEVSLEKQACEDILTQAISL